MNGFDRLALAAPLLRALEREGYTLPTPIQQQAIGPVLAGRDLLGCAQTGTGKTAAFALPILQRLAGRRPADPGRRPVRALVLCPTRELAAQVTESFRAYGHHLPLTTTEVYGGVSERPQIDALRRGTDVLVACPGRLLDLMGQGHARLDAVEVLVLDEADRMLDMGFLPDIRRIVEKVPRRRQTLLFSATLPREIVDLARKLLTDPVEVSVAPPSSPAETVRQSVYFVAKPDKPKLLRHLLEDGDITRALVFTRTKHGADRVARSLDRAAVPAAAIHGNKSQNQRARALAGFKAGRTRVLVASDIAARGLDIDGVSHVINYDLPNEPETYVHRIGRTGRAGATGAALSFCDRDEREHLRAIERLIGRAVGVEAHPFADGAGAPPPREQRPAERGPARGRERDRDRDRDRDGRGRGPRRGHEERRGGPGARAGSRPAGRRAASDEGRRRDVAPAAGAAVPRWGQRAGTSARKRERGGR
ncbi:MAG: DEAD/DEAH box helicase [Planctomycetes bacterium]|nr:DEAD/DEAH box helicase [Planctomycetota bacterium]